MLNIQEIHEAIKNLEQHCPTTYSNCAKLASLYIIRQFYNKDELRSPQGDMLMPMGGMYDNNLELGMR